LNRSQRILSAIGLATLLALAAPYLTRAVVDYRATSGKVQVFQDHSYRPQKDLVLCLIRQPGALALKVASNDLYTDEADRLAVKVVDKGDFRVVRAWLQPGQQLRPEQTAQLSECIAYAPEVKVG
jgi:hypothetical protein